ncbi:MAG TPA: lysylphosphatidylglycerol synthase domain-containing protein [Flavobacterium sp.]|jgi:hypothetical protein
MISMPDKVKHFLILVAKLVVVGAAFYFIYSQLANNDQLDWKQFAEKFEKNKSVAGILFILLLTFLNRFFEILKWQTLVASFEKISVGRASKEVLTALTAGIFTPNGIGEYGAKALFYNKTQAKNIVFLNLICNGVQMIISIIFGIIGLLYFNSVFKLISAVTVGLLLGGILLLIVILFSLKKITIKGYSIARLLQNISAIPKNIHRNNNLLALGRYAIFSHQYYFLFRAFDVHLPYLLLMATICTVYFLASSLPTFQFLDFAVKGSVAVYFFGILGVNEWITVFVTTLMWFLNVVLPVLIGSYFVLNFKSRWK